MGVSPAGYTKPWPTLSRTITRESRRHPRLLEACSKASSYLEGTVDAIRGAYEALPSEGVSVRSSATDEDLAEASFAGQYETYLNVLSFDEVILSLLRVWSSAYSPQAIAYRLNNRLPQGDVQMAVIVQRQLHPEVAGVMFTRNPVTGDEDYMVNAASGLGEGVVAGTAETDHFTMDPGTGKVLSSVVARKNTMVSAKAGGGVEHLQVPSDRAHLPVLTESQLAELTRIGQRLVDMLGGPQDVEFAVVGDEIILLQSRPVTGVGAEGDVDWESSIDPNYHWQLDGISGYGKPMFRMQQDEVDAYHRGAKQCFEETGTARTRPHILEFVHGYPYTRSPDVDEKTVTDRQVRHTELCNALVREGSSNYERNVKPTMERLLADLWQLRRAGRTIHARVAYLEAALEAYALGMGHLHWCRRGSGDREDWSEVYHQITGDPPEQAFVFVQALPNVTTRMIDRLRGLARIVRDDPDLSEIFARGRFENLRSPQLRGRPAWGRFRRRFNSLMRMHGFRTGWSYGSFSGFETPTWNKDPDRPLNIIASYAGQDLDELDRRDSEAARERMLATRRIRRRLSKTPDRLAEFNSALERAREQVYQMEDHNHLMEQCTVGHMRDAMHLAGLALVETGLLDVPEDVFHISLQELKQLAGGNGTEDLRALVRERTAERERRSRLSPPTTLGIPAEDGEDADKQETESGDDVINGTPASKGRVTGLARLVTAATRVDDWRRGDIMVAENVGQDFTPVFPLLGALVLDQGAVFQHAALVAREYRIPAVILTGDATKRIADGQTITVDGDRGTVLLGGE